MYESDLRHPLLLLFDFLHLEVDDPHLIRLLGCVREVWDAPRQVDTLIGCEGRCSLSLSVMLFVGTSEGSLSPYRNHN